MMKKFLALMISLLMFAALLAGCGTDSETPAATSPENTEETAPADDTPDETPDEPAEGELTGKLTFSVWDYSTIAYFDTLKAEFESKYPGTEIEFIDTPSAEYTDKLSIMLNGSTDFDVLLIKDADTSLSLQQKGQLEDLSPYIAQDGINLGDFNGLAEYFTFDGYQAGLPFRNDYYILYYNKDIFDAAGVDYPTNDMTWADFEEIAGQITEGSGADKKYGGHFHTWQACVQNWAVQGTSNTIMGPDYGFMKDSYEFVLRMQDAGTIPDYATLSSASIHYSSAFQTGTAGMMPMGTWFISSMIQAVNDGETDVNWGIARLPHFDGVSAGNTVGSTTPIAINAASKNKDLAWEFVKFCTGEEGAAILADAGQFPARSNEGILNKIASVDGMPENAAEALEVTGIVLDRPIVEYVNEVNQMLGEEHDLIMLGEVTIDEGLATIAERSAEIQGLE